MAHLGYLFKFLTIVLLVSSCTLSTGPSFDEPSQNSISEPSGGCPEVGCMSSVQVVGIPVLEDGLFVVALCLDKVCSSMEVVVENSVGDSIDLETGDYVSVDESVLVRELQIPGGGEHQVHITIKDDGGAVVFETNKTSVPFNRQEPNGPGCPPVCFVAWLEV